eukprot:4997451-Lingulodinium_polyedra.AAC.1
MMRSNRPSAATADRKSHVSRTPCKHHVWCWRGVCEACDLRAVVAARKQRPSSTQAAPKQHSK